MPGMRRAPARPHLPLHLIPLRGGLGFQVRRLARLRHELAFQVVGQLLLQALLVLRHPRPHTLVNGPLPLQECHERAAVLRRRRPSRPSLRRLLAALLNLRSHVLQDPADQGPLPPVLDAGSRFLLASSTSLGDCR
eukprot:scaffold517_cov255-Pinguiococcus_pyrenoidosus.AAC.9